MRASLSETEIARYKLAGRADGGGHGGVAEGGEAGFSEYDLEAMTAANLLRRGILPSVYLFAADDRILKYKHAVARGNRVETLRDAEPVRAQVGTGDFHHAVCALWAAAGRA